MDRDIKKGDSQALNATIKRSLEKFASSPTARERARESEKER